jgi:hypothetical protein
VSKVLKGVAAAALIYLTAGAGIFLAPGIFATALTMEYNGTVEPRRIIFGEARVGGMHTIPPFTTGTNNKYLHKVLTLAGHEINAITAVYFDQESVGTITSITGTANDGKITTGTFANKAWVRRYLGTSSQTADYILDTALTLWTSDHRGRGVAYAAVQYEYDEKVFKNGVPEVTCQVQGMKIYDPRLDSTNGGTGAQRVNDPTTWAYSNNPALCLAAYLMHALGVGEDSSRIDWPMVASAADECDELVTVPTASTQKRYTCNAVLYATQAYEENIELIAGAMLGTCIYSGEKWRIRAGCWASSAFTITDDNILSAEITTALPYKERYNGIRGVFIDPNNSYQPNEFPAVQSATYVSADGESVFKDVSLDACTNVYEAQRAAILMVRKSRNRQIAVLQCDMVAWKARPGETGVVTCAELGWTNKTVRCEGWKFSAQGSIELTVREELSSDWNDPVEGDYLSPLTISTPTPVYFTPDAPSSLVGYAVPDGISFQWTAPAVMPVGAIYVLYQYTANTPFASSSAIWRGITTSVFIRTGDTTTRYYWVRVEMPDGTVGPTEPTTNGLGVGGGTAGADGVGVTLSVPVWAIQCDAAGVPVSGAFTSAVGQVLVNAGDVDVTASCTFSSTTSSCTGSVNTATNTPVTGAKGSYRVTAISADSGYLEITINYGSLAYIQRFIVVKVKGGTNASSAVDDTISDITSGSYAQIGGDISVASGGNGTLRCSASADYTTDPNTSATPTTATIKVQYREAGGTWADFPSASATGSGSYYEVIDTAWVPGVAVISEQSTSASSTPYIYEFRLMGLRSLNNLDVTIGVLYASWVP